MVIERLERHLDPMPYSSIGSEMSSYVYSRSFWGTSAELWTLRATGPSLR